MRWLRERTLLSWLDFLAVAAGQRQWFELPQAAKRGAVDAQQFAAPGAAVRALADAV